MSEARDALKEILDSLPYRAWAVTSPVDARKVAAEFAGTRKPTAGSHYARGLIRLCRLNPPAPVPPPPPPPPPPPAVYVRVAPRVAYKTDRGDARYCMFNPDGTLRPGVWRDSDGFYHDEVARYARDGDGLEESGVRSPGSPADCPTGSDSIDGRPYCSLPMIGDPTKNTGSWMI